MTARADIVRWSRPPIAVELRSSDTTVLDRAASVFRPWRGDGDVIRTCRYDVEPIAGATRRWTLSSDAIAGPRLFGDVDQAIMAVEYASVASLVETPSAALCVHGALVAREGRGVLFVGRGESGKSTLGCALWRDGWSLLCDDTVVLDTSACRAIAIPRRVSLRHTSYDFVGADLLVRIRSSPSHFVTEKGLIFHPDEVDGLTRVDSVRLTAVFFLDRRGNTADRAEILPIDPGLAVVAVLPHTNARGRDLGDSLRRLAPLADAVPFFDLGRGPLDAMVAAVDRTVGHNPDL
jgi:hypothetical protein